MANDPFFSSREMAEGSTQAESIYNEFVARCHAAFGAVISRTTSVPPGLPANGDAYQVPASTSGVWLGLENNLVIFVDDWLPMPVKAGMRIFVIDENANVEFNGDGGLLGSATNGSAVVTPHFISAAWRIDEWDVIKGTIGAATLADPTILMAPINMVAGQRYILRVTQDGAGGNTLTAEVGEWATVGGGTAISIVTTALATSDILIQGPSAPLGKPAILDVYANLAITA